jgi:hypothetical protein
MRLGKSTVIALAVCPVIGLFVLTAAAAQRLAEGQNAATRALTMLAFFVLLGLVVRFMSRRWPTVFSDRVQLRGPHLNAHRAGMIIAAIAFWAGVFVLLFTHPAFEHSIQPVWLPAVVAWYAGLVASLHVMESAWLRHDSDKVGTK